MQSLSACIEQAGKLLRQNPIRGYFYSTDREGSETTLVSAFKSEQPTYVCSVGAMRLAFAQMIGDDSLFTPAGNLSETRVRAHPFYKQGMRLLGKAFAESEAIQRRYGSKTGFSSDSARVIEGAVIEVNDSGRVDWEAIYDAFDRAAEMARTEGRDGIVTQSGEEDEPQEQPNLGQLLSEPQPLTKKELDMMLAAKDSV